jgi:hypothetical protein
LAQEAVDEGRLAMINVGDDRDISNVGTAHFGRARWWAGGNCGHREATDGGRVLAGDRIAGDKMTKTRNSSTIGVRRVRRNLGKLAWDWGNGGSFG